MGWPAFYHAVKVHCVIYVVDSSVEDDTRVNLSKRHLHRLLNEDELQRACFVVTINIREGSKYNKEEDPLFFRLGLHDVKEERFVRKHMDVAKLSGEEDPLWKEVMLAIKERLQSEESY